MADSPYLITPGSPSRLAERPTATDDGLADKDAGEKRLREDGAAISDLQERLYAEGRRALLVVLQGTDTSGKDGTVRHVFRQTSPLGISVTGFGKPTSHELAHDYLWRIHKAAPRRGTIGIFNRSHYEDVLVVRVEELAPARAVEKRYDQINAFEKTLTENGTTILKFMLHISKPEQRDRLQARLDNACKTLEVQPGGPRGARPLERISGRL